MNQSSNTTVPSQKPEIGRTCQSYVVGFFFFFFPSPFFSLFLFFFFHLFVFHTEASYTVTQAFQCARIHPKGLFFKIPLLCCPPFYFVDSVLLLVFILTILICRPLLSRSDHVPKMSQLIFWSGRKEVHCVKVFFGFFFFLVFTMPGGYVNKPVSEISDIRVQYQQIRIARSTT